jgi:energy-coupling factor transporter ATP-binding protein EcfA2
MECMSSNPFATRFIRPGAISFLFLDGDSAAAIVERLKENNWRGQIIGEHGSGKSTLVATLAPLIEAAGRQVVMLKMQPGERSLPIENSSLTPVTQLILDGYEQLSWWSRLRVRWLLWRSGAGLLVTAHRDVGLPTLYTTKSSEEVASAVVNSLIAPEGSSIRASEVADAYRAAGGNVRETLFKLFDVYQQRRPPETSK